MDKDKNKVLELGGEVSVGVTFASFMSAVSLFFTGLLIAQFKSFDPTIKIPLLFLIISTFSFIFAASIYSNAGVEITSHRFDIVEKYLIYGNNILEFLGLYLFILATPMVIGAVTKDSFLRIASIIIAIGGLALYSQSEFSILYKELRHRSKRAKPMITLAIILLGIFLYSSQRLTQTSKYFGYDYVASALLIFIAWMTYYFCHKSKQYIKDEVQF